MNLVAVVQDVDLVLRWPLVAVGRIRDGQTIQHKSLQMRCVWTVDDCIETWDEYQTNTSMILHNRNPKMPPPPPKLEYLS
ncbi:hypothetical protein HanHA89_Chr05g0203981 [Helianthus annuus]|nr:hypothetical protein HanHA89_Chr05g0203981 [Helianthus annuus]